MNSLNEIKKSLFIDEFEGIKKYKLKNGLKILLLSDQSKQDIIINITYLVGSRNDYTGESGISHLLEHMLFKKSDFFNDIKSSLEDKGAFFNASTSFDYTNYYEILPANYNNLEFALHLESDRMINVLIKQKDLDSEIKVVLNESDISENDCFSVLHDQILSSAFKCHSYGRPIIGNKNDIKNISINSLVKFYTEYYQPDNAVLLISGNFKETEALNLIEKYFNNIKKPTRIIKKILTKEAVQDGEQEFSIFRSGDISTIGIAYHIPSGVNLDFPAIQILNKILTNEPNGILYKSIMKTKKADMIYGITYSLHDPSLLIIFAQTRKLLKINDLKNDLIFNVENASDIITKNDLVKAKLNMMKNFKLIISDTKILTLYLSKFIAQGDYRLFFLNIKRIKKIKINDLLRVAKTYLIPTNRTIGTFIPKENVPKIKIKDRASVKKILNNYSTFKNTIKGEFFDNNPKNIDKNIETISLKNNVKLSLLYKKTRENTVKIKLNFKFGNEKSLHIYALENDFFPEFLIRGTNDKNYNEIKEKFDSLESTFYLNSSLGILSIDINSYKDKLNEVIQFLIDIIKNPKFDEKEFHLLQQRYITQITEYLSDPEELCFNHLSRLMNPWNKSDIRYIPTLPEKINQIKSLNKEKINNFYKLNFNVNNVDISVVGSFDRNNLIKLIENNFYYNESHQKYNIIADKFIHSKSNDKIIITPEKKMGIVSLGTNIKIKYNDENYPALRIAYYIFSESIESRLIKTIREDHGLSYSVGGWMIPNNFKELTSISMYAMSSRNTIYKTLKLIKKEWMIFIRNGIKREELISAKIKFRSLILNMFSSDQFIMNQLAINLMINRSMLYYENLLNKIDNLKITDVNLIISKVFEDYKLSCVMVGDI